MTKKSFGICGLKGLLKPSPTLPPTKVGAGLSGCHLATDRNTGRRFIEQFEQGVSEARAAQEQSDSLQPPAGVNLVFRSEPDFELAVKSLEAANLGIELLNVKVEEGATLATVFIPYGRVGYFTRKFQKYLEENVTGSTKPKNQKLVESITEIRRAVLESFWTEAEEPLPNPGKRVWWEVWLRVGRSPEAALNTFRTEAANAQLDIGPRELRFPDRVVVIAVGTREQLSSSIELLDLVAELRCEGVPNHLYHNAAPRAGRMGDGGAGSDSGSISKRERRLRTRHGGERRATAPRPCPVGRTRVNVFPGFASDRPRGARDRNGWLGPLWQPC